jgi:hypothetical protein
MSLRASPDSAIPEDTLRVAHFPANRCHTS